MTSEPTSDPATTTGDPTGEPTSGRTSRDKLTELINRGPLVLRELRVGELTGGVQRGIARALGAMLPMLEPSMRAGLLTSSPAELDAALERAALTVLSLRSDHADAVQVPVDAGELELLRRHRDHCQQHHATPEQDG